MAQVFNLRQMRRSKTALFIDYRGATIAKSHLVYQD